MVWSVVKSHSCLCGGRTNREAHLSKGVSHASIVDADGDGRRGPVHPRPGLDLLLRRQGGREGGEGSEEREPADRSGGAVFVRGGLLPARGLCRGRRAGGPVVPCV